MEIVLARHGETEWSRDLKHTSHTDLPMTEHGREEAQRLRPAFAGRTFEMVLSSPMQRAVETCRAAGLGDQVETTEDLLEWDYGEYEGITTAEIREERPGWYLWRDGCPGGETAADVGRRVDRVIAQLPALGSPRTAQGGAGRGGRFAHGGDAAIFAHGHLLRVLTARWLGLGPESGALFKLDTGTISTLGYERDTRVITGWNSPVRGAEPEPR